MIVDDDEGLRRVLALLFERAGWLVAQAVDGRAGLELARRTDPDLVVTDLRMPSMSGIELARALEGVDGLASVPVLAISASERALSAAEAEGGLFAAVLHKPVSPERLLAVVRGVLDPGHQGDRP